MPGRFGWAVEPVRYRAWDDALQATVVRTVGFRWFCGCGERGRVRPTWSEARGELVEHRETHQAE